jgi:threonine dehydratase
MSVTLAHVHAAARRIAPHVRRTPLLRADALSRATGRDVHLKLETLQVTRAFKRRGACNALLARLERDGALPPLVTASAGNHGLAIAGFAVELGATLTIYVPADAPRAKLDRLRGPGVTIVADCRDYDEAEARAIAAADGARVFVSAYNDPDVIAGAGTIGLEVLEDLPWCGTIVVPTGGGGLLSGVAIAADGRAPVVGIEPAVNPAFTEALAAGHTTTIAPGQSLADGLVGNLERGALTFDLVRAAGTPIVLAPEPAIVEAVRALFAYERLVAEGAGAVAVAALLDGRLDRWPDPLVLLVTGANVDAATFARVIDGDAGPPPDASTA